jgi:hypothetical protein
VHSEGRCAYGELFLFLDTSARSIRSIEGFTARNLSLTCVDHRYVGAYVAIAEPAKNAGDTMSQGGISAMAFFYLWTVFYSPSWNGTPWVLNSESMFAVLLQFIITDIFLVFDQNVRELAQAFAASNNWFWNFLVRLFSYFPISQSFSAN